MTLKLPNPPLAKKIPKELKAHGDIRIDNYYWMRLSDDQKLSKSPDNHTREVIAYLESENEYRLAHTAHLRAFEDELYQEIVGRIKQEDTSVPYYKNGYHHITRYEKGKEYPIYTRHKASLEAEEEIFLDVNELAQGYDYYHVNAFSVSPDNRVLAYGEDSLSRRKYTIRFKDLETGELLPDKIENTTGKAVWANDNKTVFYTRRDETLRSSSVMRHILGTPADDDVEIFYEDDDTYNVYVSKTKSEKYITLLSWSTMSQEYHTINADHPYDIPHLFHPRTKGLEYSIDHLGDKWYIRTNKDGARNFKLMTCEEHITKSEHWTPLMPYDDNQFVEDFEVFKDFIGVNIRVEGVPRILIKKWSGEGHWIEFGEEAYTTHFGANYEPNSTSLRIIYTSMTTPTTYYDYEVDTGQLMIRKQQEVLGGFDQSQYVSERLMVTARDGVRVPVSLVYKKGYKAQEQKPLLLYAYGSYGHSIDPYFSLVRLSLLDRGFAYAIAHVRGGQELGRQWYEDGKLLRKMNTFHDFIDVGKYLVNVGMASKDKLFAMGGSAGGMLMGGVANMAPELWTGVIAAVPFVDVLTTMLDDSIPLTTGEYDEWGNPHDEEYYYYMKSYSPYDNVKEQDYPALLVTTGFHDSQVQYWEPAKWVAKLRDLKTDNRPLYLYCNMETGHGGASGRFRRYRETAMEYAFLLDLAGKTEKDKK